MNSFNIFRLFGKCYCQSKHVKRSQRLLSQSCNLSQNLITKQQNIKKNSAPKSNIRQEDIIFAPQILENFSNAEGDLFLDLTFGSGGHTQLLLDYFPTAKVIAIDRDRAVVNNVQHLKEKYPNRLCFLNIKFRLEKKK